jgi:hypothetical protein
MFEQNAKNGPKNVRTKWRKKRVEKMLEQNGEKRVKKM